jgi:GT2 family glycosyltransferase
MNKKEAPMHGHVKLSVSIVIYQENFVDIKACLESLLNEIPHDSSYEITIIDNGVLELNKDSDIELKCAEYFSKRPIRYILSPRNGGYGYGHNQAIFLSQADYHLIMNSDVYIMADALKNAFAFMQTNPLVGMLVPDIYDRCENRVYLCRHNPRLWIAFLRRFAPAWIKKVFTKELQMFEMRDKDYDRPIFNLTNPTGCFMLCRLDLLKAIHGFDEKLFMYYDDADIGRRMAEIAQIAYVPSVRIQHEWKRAAYHNKRMAWIAIKSALYYAWKWRWQKTRSYL